MPRNVPRRLRSRRQLPGIPALPEVKFVRWQKVQSRDLAREKLDNQPQEEKVGGKNEKTPRLGLSTLNTVDGKPELMFLHQISNYERGCVATSLRHL